MERQQMMARRRRIGILVCALSAAAASLGLAANNSPRLDPRDEAISAPGMPNLGIEPALRPDLSTSGNPLWAIPLKSLSATRERPIFLPSRRAPAPAVAAAYVEPPKTAPPPPEPDRPALRLVGVVTGTADGFAVFISDTTRDIIRLKTGEGHEGWILRSVKAREAVLEKNRRSAVIELPQPAGSQK